MAAADLLLGLLRGRWALIRQITPGGRFEGTAIFVPGAGLSLAYHESGRLTLDQGAVLDAGASAVYAARHDAVAISFGDGPGGGGHFIDIALPEGWPAALPASSTDRHVCGPDIYDATFRLEHRDRFTMTYLVRGPAKHYVSHAMFHRVQP